VLDAAFGPRSPIRSPILLIASGTDLNLDLQNSSRVAAMALAMAAADAVVALSPDLRDQARALLGTDVRLILQAPSVDTASDYSLRRALGLGDEQPLVLLPAGIRPVKGIALAIEAGAQALLEFPEHVMVILGPVLDADYHAHCASLIREWSLRHRALKGRLLMKDGLPRADYLAALREAALLLNCSSAEAVSNAVLEAFAAGVPVLARDIPGNRAVITHGQNALLFDGLPAFLREYRQFFTDPALRDRLRAAARAQYAAICDSAAERSAYLTLAEGLIGTGR
jgi:glycosyltransferase involved in cell wall biosynthesis